MQQLHVLTKNNLGEQFWKQRAGLIDEVKLNDLELNTLESIFDQQAKFILVDLYFCHYTMDAEVALIQQIEELAKQKEGPFTLLILSPFYSDQGIKMDFSSKQRIIRHHFSSAFLELLLKIGRNISIDNEIKASYRAFKS